MVGIIILNYKTYKETIECIKSIRKTTSNIDYRIVVVDNCSPNESYDILKKAYAEEKDIYIIKSETNGGYSKGNNIGLNYAKELGATDIVISNNDVIYKDNAIKYLVEALYEKANIAIASPLVYDITESEIKNPIQKTIGYRRWKLITKGSHLNFKVKMLGWLMYNNHYKYDKNYIYDGIPPGCCFAITMKTFAKLNYFDENVFLYFEENILAVKIKQLGMKNIICKDSKIIHLGEVSTGGLRLPIKVHFAKSEMYYFKKYIRISNRQLTKLYNINQKALMIIFANDPSLDESLKDLSNYYEELL